MKIRRIVLVLGLCVLASFTFWMPQVWQRMGKRFNRKFGGASKTEERRSHPAETISILPTSRPDGMYMYSKTVTEESNLSKSQDMHASTLDQAPSRLDAKDNNEDTASLHKQQTNTTLPSLSQGQPLHTKLTDNTEHHASTSSTHNDSIDKSMDHAATSGTDNASDTSSSKKTSTSSGTTKPVAAVQQKKSRRRSSAANSSTKSTQIMPKGDAQEDAQRPPQAYASDSDSPSPHGPDVITSSTNASVPTKGSTSTFSSNPPQQLSESPEIASCVRPVNLSQFQGLPPEHWNEYLGAIDQAVSARCDFFAYPRSNGTLVMTYRSVCVP
jgi:hypothetical protein